MNGVYVFHFEGYVTEFRFPGWCSKQRVVVDKILTSIDPIEGQNNIIFISFIANIWIQKAKMWFVEIVAFFEIAHSDDNMP